MPIYDKRFLSALCANLFMLLLPPHGAAAQAPAGTATALDIVMKSQQAFYYPGKDMKAKVRMELITDTGKARERILVMLRKNEPNSESQKYFMYFREPGDVRGMALLVNKYPERDDDRWIFIPALGAVRRIAASDSRSSFVGSDFTYEDVSGRDLSADTHTLLREEKVGDKMCYVIQSVPKGRAEYTKKLAWIDKNTFLPIREEYYDAQNEISRLFTADLIERIESFRSQLPTAPSRGLSA